MAWSYSGDPAASSRDEVRFLIGDTDADEQLLQDAEIEYLIDEYPTVRAAAAAAARAIAAMFARQVDERVGDMALSLSQRVEHFTKLAAELERSVASDGCAPAYVEPHDALWSLEEEATGLSSGDDLTEDQED